MSDSSAVPRVPITARSVVVDTLRGQRRLQVRASLLLGTWQLMEASAPILVGFVIDRAIAGQDGGDLIAGLVVLTGLFAALTLGYRFGARAVVGAEAGAPARAPAGHRQARPAIPAEGSIAAALRAPSSASSPTTRAKSPRPMERSPNC